MTVKQKARKTKQKKQKSKTKREKKKIMKCRAVEKALVAGHTKLLMLESPTNPRMQICDIATLTQMAHQVCCASLCACCALFVLCSVPSALHFTAACFVLSWQVLWLP